MHILTHINTHTHTRMHMQTQTHTQTHTDEYDFNMSKAYMLFSEERFYVLFLYQCNFLILIQLYISLHFLPLLFIPSRF